MGGIPVRAGLLSISCFDFGGIAPGDSLSGFLFHDTTEAALLTIDWSIAAIQLEPFFSNPVFTGTAEAVPEPRAVGLVGLGLFVLVPWRVNGARKPTCERLSSSCGAIPKKGAWPEKPTPPCSHLLVPPRLSPCGEQSSPATF